jgi:catechol 2,3-dioxygenase-like lactoylglutathione lyase family enzyme
MCRIRGAGNLGEELLMLANTKAYSGFAVDDLKKAQEFYGETLGLKVSVLDENALLSLHLAGGRDTVVYLKPDFVPATYTILNFEVDDVDEIVDGLIERGVRFEKYEGFEQDEKGVARGFGPDIAWFKDPAGNILSVVGES